jgi:serine/threonine protein kinase
LILKMKKKLFTNVIIIHELIAWTLPFDRTIEEIDLKMTKYVGTPNCMSPEVLSRKNYNFKVK